MSGSILYIHGFNSAPESKKASQLITVMQRMGLGEQLRVPALHHHPRQAIGQLQAAIRELGSPLLVGSSLGGYYATWLARQHGLKALLVNPAVSPHRMFDGYLGTQTNHYSGETWELTHDHVQALAELEVLGILVDADGVGVLHAARQDDCVVLLAAGALECLVDLEVVRRFVVVPAFDLAGLGGKDVDLGAGLLQCLLGTGQFDLFETVCYQNGDAFAVEGSGHR